MQIVTVSGFKGGTGRTTLASLIAVGAELDGRHTAGLVLNVNTRNVSSILTRRRAAELVSPDHVMRLDVEPGRGRLNGCRFESLIGMVRETGYDLLVIDTGSASHEDLHLAHALTDVVLTPMNDSPADRQGLFAAKHHPQAATVNYRHMVETARFARRTRGLPA